MRMNRPLGKRAERMQRCRWCSVVLVGLIGIIGVACVVQPALIEPSAVPAEPTKQAAPERGVAFACTAQTCQTVTLTSPINGGLFSAGQSDLTGDGVPEQVRRTGETACVFEEGAEMWCSPPEWRVRDLALGDPNDDGRYEIMLAFWKDDAQGVPRSHPFIVGYREGRYRTVWGGSPVSEPIAELDLGDVDGDGDQDLVVLDAAERTGGETGRTVSVWRWHGWGFSLMWRSPGAHYQDLTLVPGDAGAPAMIAVEVIP